MRPHKYTIPMFLLSFAGLASANPQASSLARMQSGRADGEPLRSPTAILDFTATSVQGTSVLGTPTQPSPQPDDQDRDGIADPKDNCPTAVNPGQEDSNANGVGDVCESTCETVWARPIADVGLNDDIDDFGDAQSAWIRTAWGPQDEKVGLFQFEDIKVPEYSQIANAAMIFFAVPTSSQSYVGLHRVLAEWDEVTAQDMDWTPDGKLWDRNAEYQFMAPGGYAVADEEAEPGVAAIAVAIREPNSGMALGTTSVAGPIVRLPRERHPEIALALRQAAEELARIWPLARTPPAQGAITEKRSAR